MQFKNWLVNIQDWWLPRLCPACDRRTGPGQPLCTECHHDLPWSTSACVRCAVPLPDAGELRICGRCQSHPPSFAATMAAFRYEAPIDHFVRSLKFRRELGLASLLGNMLADSLRHSTPPDRIIPVPLHHSRLRERGFNQSLEIARPLARFWKRPLDVDSVVRRRDTRPQTALSRRDRRRNVRGAFQARTDFQGQRIAIVDDVMTTGETVDQLARELLRAHAVEIQVWVVARAAAPD